MHAANLDMQGRLEGDRELLQQPCVTAGVGPPPSATEKEEEESQRPFSISQTCLP